MRALILGGTGAMGVHVTRLLVAAGYEVAATSRRDRESGTGVTYVRGDAKSMEFLRSVLEEHWDVIVDFMVWSTAEFVRRRDLLLSSTDQYVFLSSYRVYADSPTIKESSPRLLDVCDNAEYLATDEYALAKARCEDALAASGSTNWTIVRPAITYDGSGRFQLGVHEAGVWLWRALRGIPVPLPGEMLGKQATMTWGGDVARMIVALVGNPEAMGEAFTVSTAEHVPWSKVAEAYQRCVPGLEVVPCGLSEFELARGDVWQIRYDRMFDRVVDNSKVLAVTGIAQDSLARIGEGIPRELGHYLNRGSDPRLDGPGVQARMDRLLGGCPSLRYVRNEWGVVGIAKYLVRRGA